MRSMEAADLPPHSQLSLASMISVAQAAGVEKLAVGSVSGSAKNLRISFRLLDMQTLKMSGEFSVSGPPAALPQMENELAWLLLGQAGLRQGQTRDAFESLTRRISNAAYSAWIQALDLEDGGERLKVIRRVIALAPEYSDAHRVAGRLYYEQNNWIKAAEHLEVAERAGDTDLEERFYLANCHLLQGRLDDAIRIYSAVLAFVPSAAARNNLGIACMKRGDLQMASQNLVDARNLARSSPIIHVNLAIIRYLQGDLAVARSLLGELKPGSAHGPADILLGMIHLDLGEPNLAAAEFKRAARLGLEVEVLRKGNPADWTRVIKEWRMLP